MKNHHQNQITFICLLLVLVSFVTSAQNSKVTKNSIPIEVKPDLVYLEKDDSNQYLNFDLIITNNSKVNIIPTTVEVSIFDDKGLLTHRDFINLYSRESLELAQQKVIAPQGIRMIYNPFTVLDKNIPIHTMKYELSFQSEDGKENFLTEVNVAPKFYQTKTNLILPVKGRVLIWDGHDYSSHHRRFDYTDPYFVKRGSMTNFQRYGYDFVVVDEKGTMYKGQEKVHIEWYDDKHDSNSDYYGFGTAIYATGDGVVVDAQDGVEDNRTFNEADLAKNEKAYGGNYIIIDHLNGEFSWFGHLKKGSVKVKKGDKVKQGTVIGAMGASGSSLFPHLHYELRNGDGANHVEGLPSYFTNYTRILGSKKVPVKKGLVNSGNIVESK
nr:M23 family metallopeptidase [uncultured Flavobacterium sp.]